MSTILNKISYSPSGVMVELSSPELLFLGESGQPYRGTLYVTYFNNGIILDMLSFKKFITSLRHKTFLFEDIAKYIHDSVIESLNSTSIVNVTIDLTARGGIQSRTMYGELNTNPIKKPLVFQM